MIHETEFGYFADHLGTGSAASLLGSGFARPLSRQPKIGLRRWFGLWPKEVFY
jgi:hypothetical protein